MRSDLSSLGIQMEEVMPSFRLALDANFESLSSQLESFKREIIQAI